MQERRQIPRTTVNMSAKVMASDECVHECAVRDISIRGALLEFRATDAIPNVFGLTFASARTIRVCNVAWRTNTQLGVEFRSLSIGRAA